MATPTDPRVSSRLSLFDVCRDIATSCPPLNAPAQDIAAWFTHFVGLLAPITRDQSHPEHDEAVVMAAKYSHSALAMREAARKAGAAR